MNEYRIKIGGLDCPNCTAKLERGIKANKNFYDVSLSFVNKLLILKSELTLEEVKFELNKIINKIEPDAYIDEDALFPAAAGPHRGFCVRSQRYQCAAL